MPFWLLFVDRSLAPDKRGVQEVDGENELAVRSVELMLTRKHDFQFLGVGRAGLGKPGPKQGNPLAAKPARQATPDDHPELFEIVV